MARPREFDEDSVLDAAVRCFWTQGYEATSVRVLADRTGLTTASLYNAFGDKRALYRRALDHYVENGVTERIRRCRDLPPRRAIEAFFAEIVERSLADGERKGCLLVNAAIDVAPHDPGFQAAVAETLGRMEGFFRDRAAAGQADGTISRSWPPETLARHLLGVLMGLRVLARVRPEPDLIHGAVAPALALLDR
jgi:TetR/AcrR family transcriptional regulator, transcriptional repressor for nem operon